MASSQITFTISLIMIALFSIAIISFAVNFAIDNDSYVSIADDPEFSDYYIDVKSDMSTFKDDSEGTYASILETTVEPGSDVAPSIAPFTGTTGGMIKVAKNVILLPYKKIFGSGEGFGIFFTVFGAIIAFIIILLGYKTLRGNP
jgi:hypothetical protein